jgi:hypothetical protein
VPLVVLRDEYINAPTCGPRSVSRALQGECARDLAPDADAGGLTRQRLWAAYEAELGRLRAIPKGSGGDPT